MNAWCKGNARSGTSCGELKGGRREFQIGYSKSSDKTEELLHNFNKPAKATSGSDREKLIEFENCRVFHNSTLL